MIEVSTDKEENNSNFKEVILKTLTNTPDPRMPPKYQTSSVMLALSTEFPPGKKRRMLQRTQTIERGSRVIPKHFAKPPEHIFVTDTKHL